MDSGIFVSYRRQDVPMAAGRLGDDLKDCFGERQIFRDVETIEPGEDFTVVLGRALDDCAVMLAVIGPQWLDLRDPEGRRRLDDPADWTRMEIGTALARNIRVVPVLVEGARMPDPDRLPDDLKGLVRRQALELSDKNWKSDVARLIAALGKILPPGPRPVPPPAPEPAPRSGASLKKYAIGAALVLGVLLAAGMLYEDPAPTSQPQMPLVPVATDPGVLPAPQSTTFRAGDLSGNWSDGVPGKIIVMRQSGSHVEIEAMFNSVMIGKGSGTLAGTQMRIEHDDWSSGVAIHHSCQMSVLADGRRISGACQNLATGFQMAVMLIR